ncbi:MAG: DNA polymerase III subunit alpha [Lewinellaceae bacterium]|nr:DNA polymerase III subunit alpha [Saprospiraceae bacterium]MCB9338284.1 DNA polymerase III subunit alpha [Lewinellaceae bacterium]
MPHFCHLHCHTQYSLLDGASDIGKMMDKAQRDGQKGVALTDHGNMFGAFQFVNEANKRGIKPIVGCEFYLVDDRHKKQFLRSRNENDNRYHQLMLAKNRQGYENLSKLCSLGFIEGLYSKYPRIDKELIEKYHEGLIATSCCIGAEIPQTILTGNIEKAEELLKWWLNIFGEDYYIELQRHRGMGNIDGTGMSQEDVNQVLLGFAKKYNVKVICTNDSHYVEEEDYAPHDILLCVNTNSLLEDTNRFKFPSSDFYFKTQDEMNRLFGDVPQAVDYTQEILDKIEPLKLTHDVLLPAFPIPQGFQTQDDYLRHLTFQGAKKRYGHLTPEIEERLNFELQVIKQSGYPGYFLIVQDFTNTARQMGVSVGPGRGSAAGSAVAYCIGITNVDPIKYDLLFERFLNPERVSMPDIDIDFDDRGRDQVINYVLEKYGRNQVAQIVTYGTMAAKSSLRDVGRVMNVPLSEVDRVAKSFPHQLGATLADVLADGDVSPKLKEKLNNEDVERANNFRLLAAGDDDIAKMIQTARKLEGSVRNTGIHACGVVITPDDITKYVPVTVAKDSDLLVSQFDNSVAEAAGLLKMDFLGLKTLTIIKDAVRIIKEVQGIDIVPDDIPLDDPKTYELFQRGETIAIFQYESEGMQKHMKDLKPTTFEDLIAMNALYRPGPLAYIPDFIARKHGRQEITYDLPAMEEYLEETYGITVYQEQVMLLSQKLAGFTKGEADVLRKAMGKKQKAVLDKMFPKFMEGCAKNGHQKEVCEKVWKDWEAFASYAFNKSHSTCYAYVAFQTAYLKANYPAEFMAAVLSNNKDNITDLTKFLRECRRMGVTVLGPDINESVSDFTVNKEGQIRFGLSALKGVGEGPVDEILAERDKGGKYADVFDLLKRLDAKSTNKKVLESLVLGGALDCYDDMHRAQYFTPSGKYDSFIEELINYGNKTKTEANTLSLFANDEAAEVQQPEPPKAQPWSLIEKLEREKEVTGIYISGHPLDDYRLEVENFTTCTLEELEERKGQQIKVAGIVTNVSHRISKKGTGWGTFTIQDFNGSLEFPLFSDDYMKFKGFFEQGNCVFITGQYEPRWGREDEFQLRIKEVTLLENASKNLANSITLKLPVESITVDILDKLDDLFKKHKGQHQLRITLMDYTNRTSLPFVSGSKKVNVDNDLVSGIAELGVDYVVG